MTPEDLAVVAGPSAIGLLTEQTVKAASARVVVLGTDADAHRLRLAAELGADHVFSVQSDDYRAAIGELSAGAGADIVYECSGAGASAQGLLEQVRRGGQYAQIGLFGKPVAWDLDQVCYKELAVTGSNASVPSAWERALKLLADGTAPPSFGSGGRQGAWHGRMWRSQSYGASYARARPRCAQARGTRRRHARCCEDRYGDLTRPWPHGYSHYVTINKMATRALGRR